MIGPCRIFRFLFIKKPTPKIPKIIHLCWFSGEIPPLKVLKCLLTWKIYLPDYKIVLWNKKKALATGLDFVREAIEERKWAFAADAIRVYAVYNYGGIYMDSDILVKRRFVHLLNHDNVFFREYWPERAAYEKEHPELPRNEVWGQEIQAAMFAAKKRSPVIGSILEHYKNTHFRRADGTLNMCPIAPQIFSQCLETYGYKYLDEHQHLREDTIVYTSHFVLAHPSFSHFAVHMCTQSWK